jgi:hypothetical protein
MARTTWRATATLSIFLVGVAPLLAVPKTDVVELLNGDRITCEIRALERGKLTVKTDGVGTIAIEWDDVERVTSAARFDIQLASGQRVFGSLARGVAGSVDVVRSSGPQRLLLADIVRISPLGDPFWGRLEGAVYAGFSFTQANVQTQWTLHSRLSYRSRWWLSELAADSALTSREDADRQTRNTLSLETQRFPRPHLFPESEGTHAKLSSLHYTQVFGGKYVLQAGRFNTIDLYSAHPFTGGEGLDRFMNLSLVAPPVSGRTVPPDTEGVLFSMLRGATPALTVGVIESTEEGFFDNGVTFLWSVSPPWKLSDKPGGIAFGGELSSFEGTSLDQSPWALLPESPVPLAREQGTWTLNVTVDQFLRMHPADPTTGWGVFGMFGVSDGNPSFLELQAFAGLGGASPFERRSKDTWGVGYFVNGVSGDLEDTLDPPVRTRDEHGFEVSYSWAPVGWSRVSADLQVIDPFLVRSETRAFFAIRWKSSSDAGGLNETTAEERKKLPRGREDRGLEPR